LWVLGRTELKTAVITETRGGEKLLCIVWFFILDVNMSERFDSKISLSLPGEMKTPRAVHLLLRFTMLVKLVIRTSHLKRGGDGEDMARG